MDHVNYITRDVFGVHFRMIRLIRETTLMIHEIWSDLVILLPRRIICILVVFIAATVVLVVVAF